ncbi:response regulator transcription factor [Falsibacillus pallidus]|uniref:DNA-binding response OmpR family regulator n=1 Tax=Falsibacillus pallidus TaxID=493781 RepID=A0A370GQB9_9BACI|nr:DNA-binding response OmpR family regulator [Falsibacillus pallidus]
MNERILVVEDENSIAKILKIELEYEGYEVIAANDGRTGFQLALEGNFDLILLDVMLPELNGMEVLRKIRKENDMIPIILLTARNMTMDKVAGLDLGANDYITKPFEMEELLARVRSSLRQSAVSTSALKAEEEILTINDIMVNPQTREVERGGKPITLTPKEFDFLVYLLANKNRIVTRDNIINNVWGYEYEGETNVIDVYIRHLRKKLEEDFSDSQIIHTVRGVGYIIKES